MVEKTAKRRVCLVTPGHLSTNPRLVKEADALVTEGYEVTIVAARFISWADEADKEFADRVWQVEKVPFGPLAGRRQHLWQSLGRRASLLIFRLTGALAAQAFHPVVPALTRAVCAVKADLYIAHNLAALPAACAAARRYGARLGFDAEDFHRGELTEAPEQDLALRLTQTIEDTYLPGCDYVTAASPGIARAYAAACGIDEPTVVLNVFPKSDAPTALALKETTAPSLYWFSQTVGPNRGLETVIEAMGLSKSRPMLFLRGSPAMGYVETLSDLARRHGVIDCLHLLPTAPPGAMVRLASQYDLGIASEPGHTVNNRIALSNKLFTFLLAGVPVLASSTPAQVEIAAEMSGAVLLYPQNDAQALARHIDDLCQSLERLAHARKAAWQLGQTRFNWNVESAKFLSVAQRLFD